MREFTKDVGKWLWLVISSWRQYAEAGITGLIWALIEKGRGKPVSWGVLEFVATVFLLLAFFNVWRDEVKKHGETNRRLSSRIAEQSAFDKSATPEWHSELAKEKLQLEDQVAEMEAQLQQETYSASFSRNSTLEQISRAFGAPNKVKLLQGKIERRKKRLKEIGDLH